MPAASVIVRSKSLTIVTADPSTQGGSIHTSVTRNASVLDTWKEKLCDSPVVRTAESEVPPLTQRWAGPVLRPEVGWVMGRVCQSASRPQPDPNKKNKKKTMKTAKKEKKDKKKGI